MVSGKKKLSIKTAKANQIFSTNVVCEILLHYAVYAKPGQPCVWAHGINKFLSLSEIQYQQKKIFLLNCLYVPPTTLLFLGRKDFQKLKTHPFYRNCGKKVLPATIRNKFQLILEILIDLHIQN